MENSLPSDRKLVVFTVINEAYMHLGLAWAQRVRETSGIDPVFICSDLISHDFLSSHGFLAERRVSDRLLSTTAKTNYPMSSFPNDDASYTVCQKLTSALSYLQQGHAILFSDVDAIWIRNPIQEILSIDTDISFQPGSFPVEVKAAWGFSVCTGFFYLRPTDLVISLIKSAIRRFDGSDQRSVNLSLMGDFDISWASRPEKWEHCRIEDGWTTCITGRCEKSGLHLTALPHVYYQRHGTKPENWQHSYICHPNSPKNAENKFSILRALGISI